MLYNNYFSFDTSDANNVNPAFYRNERVVLGDIHGLY